MKFAHANLGEKKKSRKLRFVTFFPSLENIHFPKDVGMIPYILHKNHNYDALIMCKKNDEHSYLKTETPGLRLHYINEKSYHEIRDSWMEPFDVIRSTIEFWIPFFYYYGKKIDVFQLYHLSLMNLIAGTLFKMFNRKGICYLKLDLDPSTIQKNKPRLLHDIQRSIRLKLAFDIISAEIKEAYEYLKFEDPVFRRISERIILIPNGIDTKRLISSKSYQQKENIIVHIGRLGSYQKGTEIILRAFFSISQDFRNWKLVFIGKMEEEFKKYFYDYLELHNELKNNIVYVGFVKSRDSLFQYLEKSKILAFPSRYEAFGIAAIEAGAFGNVIIGSDIPSIKEITNNGKLGFLCPVDDLECFQKKLRYAFSHEKELENMSAEFKKYVLENYYWDGICKKLNEKIIEVMNENSKKRSF